MASTSTTTRTRRARRVGAFTGPRLRPLVRRGRAAHGRPGGVAAPSVERPLELFAAGRAGDAVTVATPRTNRVVRPAGRVGAPAAAPAVVEQGVRLTERGMLAVLVVFGGLVAAAAAVVVVSFFQVSNAPLHEQPANAGISQAVAGGPVNR